MKKMILFFFTISCFSQAPSVEWMKNYGGSNTDYCRNAIATSDGGYILLGSTSSNNGDVTINQGNADLWVVKIDSNGIIQWQKTYGGSSSDTGESIKETPDGYIIIGGTYSNDGDVIGHHGVNSDLWILKINTTGEIQWQKTLGTNNHEIGTNIILTADGGYLAIGEKSIKYWIIKMNNLGTIEWEKNYGGTRWSSPYDLLQTEDNGYIVIGDTASHDGDVLNNHGSGESTDIWLLKLSPTGTIDWQKCYGGTGYERGFRIRSTSDGGYILAGDATTGDGDLTGNYGFDDIWILKINNIGTIEWQKNYGGSGTDYSFDIFQTADSGYIFCGMTNSINGNISENNGLEDMLIMRLDNSGNIVWHKVIGGSAHEAAFNVLPAADGGFFVSGYTDSNDGDIIQSQGLRDFWAVKLFPENLSTIDFESRLFTIYPNPATNSVNLNFKKQQHIEKVGITDIFGKMVLQQTGNPSKINIETLESGIYFIKAYSKDKTYQSKFIKQ